MMSARQEKRRTSVGVILGLAVFALLFLLFFSGSTSPLVTYSLCKDSFFFQTLGMAWAEGKIPFIDTFDHKGPLIFFIDMLGYRITGNGNGILLIQLPNLFFYFFLAWKMLRELGFSEKRSLALFAAMVGFMALPFNEGNMTEEYSLPWIMLALLLQNRYFTSLENGSAEHKPLWAAWYGVGAAQAILTRATNMLTIGVGVAVIVVILCLRKQWSSLLKNAGAFLLGFALLVLPFVIYYWSVGGLAELYESTIAANVRYFLSAKTVGPQKLFTMLKFLLFLLPSFGLAVTGLQMLFGKRKARACWYALLGLVQIVFFLRGYPYTHYLLLVVPEMLLVFGEISRWKLGNKLRCAVWALIFALCLATFAGSCLYRVRAWKQYRDTVPAYVELAEMIPEGDTVVGYNAPNAFYIRCGIVPAKKYCLMQHWQAELTGIAAEIHEDFAEDMVDWIVAVGDTEEIQDILESSYEIYAENQGYILYHRK